MKNPVSQYACCCPMSLMSEILNLICILHVKDGVVLVPEIFTAQNHFQLPAIYPAIIPAKK